MIKVGILGAESPKAGELIRILINHPETVLQTIHSPLLRGHSVSSVHHGLIGEEPLTFTDKISPDELDVLFLTSGDEFAEKLIVESDRWPDLKIIVFPGIYEPNNLVNPEIGLSEPNRKNLVRGAKMAFIPEIPLATSLIALVPLAKYMLLNSDISIKMSIPHNIIDEISDSSLLASALSSMLVRSQPSLVSPIEFLLSPNNEEERVAIMDTVINCSLPLEEILKIYNEMYDDHNFTFITQSPVNIKEVEGTQKCVIKIAKPSADTLQITTLADARMRGGVGDAIHVMNLFEGLHEKTGLQLKSSAYSPSSQV